MIDERWVVAWDAAMASDDETLTKIVRELRETYKTRKQFFHAIDAWRVMRKHGIEALREMARQSCVVDNCGTVCLCGPCHASKALEVLDPEWRP